MFNMHASILQVGTHLGGYCVEISADHCSSILLPPALEKKLPKERLNSDNTKETGLEVAILELKLIQRSGFLNLWAWEHPDTL